MWTLELAAEAADLPGPVNSLSVAADGVLAAGTFDRVLLLDTDLVPSGSIVDEYGQVWGVAWSPTADVLATASAGRGITVVTREGVAVWPSTAAAPGAGGMAVTWSPDGAVLAGGTRNGEVVALSGEDGSVVARLSEAGSPVISLAYSPDGRWLAAGDLAGRVSVWSTGDWELVTETPSEPGRHDVNGLAWSPDSSMLAAARQADGVRVYATSGWSSLTQLDVPGGWQRAVAFAPDGHTLAAAGQDGMLRAWTTDSWTLVAEVAGHDDAVWSLSWMRDGEALFSGSGRYQSADGDRSVRKWRLTTTQTP